MRLPLGCWEAECLWETEPRPYRVGIFLVRGHIYGGWAQNTCTGDFLVSHNQKESFTVIIYTYQRTVGATTGDSLLSSAHASRRHSQDDPNADKRAYAPMPRVAACAAVEIWPSSTSSSSSVSSSESVLPFTPGSHTTVDHSRVAHAPSGPDTSVTRQRGPLGPLEGTDSGAGLTRARRCRPPPRPRRPPA